MTNTERLKRQEAEAEKKRLLAEQYSQDEDGEISLKDLTDEERKQFKAFSLESEIVDDFESAETR